jgi:hypothetical protein
MRHIPETLIDVAERTTPPAAMPSGPFDDIPGSIWTGYLSAWSVLFGLFVLFYMTNGPAALDVVTACFFAMMLLGLPAALGLQNHDAHRRHKDVVETLNGPLPVRAAAAQILLIPVCVGLGLVALIVLTK